MGKYAGAVVCLVVVSLAWPGKALPQTASPDALAAAKELMTEARLADQINTMLPAIMQQLKPLIAKGNPLIERDYDALVPVMMKIMNSRMDEYARHFTAEEMRQVVGFYRTPAGRKFLQKQPEVFEESMALGQQFGQAMARDVQDRMSEELRKRGHNI
jgi:uncharacterized protein